MLEKHVNGQIKDILDPVFPKKKRVGVRVRKNLHTYPRFLCYFQVPSCRLHDFGFAVIFTCSRFQNLLHDYYGFLGFMTFSFMGFLSDDALQPHTDKNRCCEPVNLFSHPLLKIFQASLRAGLVSDTK